MKYIIDVDTGVDDAIALMYLAQQKNICGVTTVCGNVPLSATTKNTSFILQQMNSKLPVYRGCDKPIQRPPVHDFDAHGADTLGKYKVHQDMAYNLCKEIDAVSFMENCLNEGPTHIIALAPLTNISSLISRGNFPMENLTEITIMGGVINDVGNITPSAEFNFYADPEAAKIVINSGVNINLIPLDITRKVILTPEDLSALPIEIKDKILNILSPYIDMYKSRYGIHGAAVHDLTAVISVFHPELFYFESVCMDIETNSSLNDGRCVVDFRHVWGKENNVNLCVKVENAEVIKMFINSIWGDSTE